MASNNKSYRIRTKVGKESDTFLDVHLDQEYDSLEILSLKISDKDVYKLHNSDYGVVVGRVIANGNFGVPNAKISVFIEADEQNSNLELWNLYPYTSTSTKNDDGIRYNLLPDESVKDCHKAVGTFPHKTFLLENDSLLEVFDDYYIYTTRTNSAGDYLICGVPTGMQTIHMDLDLSDCGILSQRPRDFVYKGYTIEQFENPNQFKKDDNIDGLSQIFTQNHPVYVNPFWGNADNGETIGITRADIEISFKFEPTCVFMGSAISDNSSNGVGKKCVPTNQMGAMDELTAGEGTIEMIRKTPGGNVEEFSIKGNQLIDGNGVWCYQIPMNLDYMMTDEYGNMVPTDDPEKGLPTRTRVRFRASLTDMDGSSQSYYRAKYLVPNNPGIDDTKVDYNFGTYTDEDSYRDLFWNGVYTVKSYIPRFQKSKRWRSERFSGIKACNYYGSNNPMPYNNMRIKLPFMFTVLCIFVKLFIKIVTLVNRIIAGLLRVVIGVMEMILSPFKVLGVALKLSGLFYKAGEKLIEWVNDAINAVIGKIATNYGLHCTFIGDGLCPDMEGWYYAPGCGAGFKGKNKGLEETLMRNTLEAITSTGNDPGTSEDSDKKDMMNSTEYTDETSIDNQNTSSSEEDTACLTKNVDYLLNCFEMNLAQEYRVIKFDFYNDWVNGVLYFPRWMRKIKRKKKYKFSLKDGITSYYKDKVKGCMNSENSRVKKSRYYTQQCSLTYKAVPNEPWTAITTYKSCYDAPKTPKNKSGNSNIFPSKCHKRQGMTQSSIFGKKSGLVTEETTMLGQYVYYLKPCEWKDTDNGKKRTLLFATDIVLLGTLNDCDENGIPQAFKYLNNSSYIMPTNLALTTMDDDSYIYSSDKGTVCSSSNKPSSKNKKPEEDSFGGPRRITPDYQTTYSAYSQTDGDQVNYAENDDPIPVTEAAGITWNYSGPGQDDVPAGRLETPSELINRMFESKEGQSKYEFLYYPGGHFLGLSCVNSDTNIKSCVNLKRICEVGATMSQRREELRGYTADGEPKYRYYVPTGLISNVDIEGASFRSMFASLNHNKLVATERSETTGYKKYAFRFLRPDGFDGSLGNYVHKEGSPYNKSVNGDLPEEERPIKDATEFFLETFAGLWFKPDDYDPDEAEFTERRTVEDSVNDYYMFRFGLNSFDTKEQKKHFLIRNTKNTMEGGYTLPQYENSFYFYFGLKDGSTALDEFKKQFFSECESNNVSKTPVITVNEKIDDNLESKATLVIDNMLPSYTVKITDDTKGDEPVTFTVESDTVNLEDRIGIEIGHQYTISVTDSLDQTVTYTFVFGSSAVKVDAETVHFRIKSDNDATNDPKKGGYVKISDTVIILGKQYSISSGEVEFTVTKVSGDGEYDVSVQTSNYTDASGEYWNLYYLPGIGQYNFYVSYSGSSAVSIYTSNLRDNRNVNLFVGCDYLSYKPEIKNTGEEIPSRVLSGITDWSNGTPFMGADWENWLMRHSYYRQTPDNTAAYDAAIYTKGDNEIAIFGQPEKGTLASSGEVYPNHETFYRGSYDEFKGYFLDANYTYYPTMYWDGTKENPNITDGRNLFDAMAYNDNGQAAADASDVVITGYTYDTTTNKFTLDFMNNNGTIQEGHGCIVVFEDGTVAFPVCKSGHLEGTLSYDLYPNGSCTQELLEMITVYPTLQIPVIYKPMYSVICAVTWNLPGIRMTTDTNGETIPEKFELPTSYKVEGQIYNGLTFGNHFYSGDTAGVYDTYMIFNNESKFWNGLSAITADDYIPQRSLSFGCGEFQDFGREITTETANWEDEDDIQTISYAVKEGIPSTNVPSNVYTGEYEGGFDQMVLQDSFSIDTLFYDNIKIKVANSNNSLGGNCFLYTNSEINNNISAYCISNANTKPLFPFDMVRDVLILRDDDSGKFFSYGYYNELSKYDKKGKAVNVMSTAILDRYKYSVTQENGVRINKTSHISSFSGNGVTLLHRHALDSRYKDSISALTETIENYGTNITIMSDSTTGTTFIPNNYESLVLVYERPDNGSMNKMIVYKLYPMETLDVMYVLETDGVEPYLNATDSMIFSKDEQSATIPVSTNVRFSASTNSSWITVSPSEYSSTATSINVSLTKNPDTDNSRYGIITLYCIEPDIEGVSNVTINIEQLRDDLTPVKETAERAEGKADDAQDTADSAQSSASMANRRLDDVEDDISDIESDIAALEAEIAGCCGGDGEGE